MIIKNNKNLFHLIFLLFSISLANLQAQVTIGSGAEPQGGALLDLKENKDTDHNSTKGVLYPRVRLSKRDELYPMYGDANSPNTEYETNKIALKKAHTGLVVYNLTSNTSQTTTDVFQPGIFYWDGEQWRLMANSPMLRPSINELKCEGATLIPNIYTQGVPYKGILKVPYIGGNGAPYLAATIAPVNGLEATLQPGELAIGTGELFFDVTGTPTVSSPEQTGFSISFAGISCTALVGNGREIKVMEYAKFILPISGNAPSSNSEIYSIPVTMGNLNIQYKRWDHGLFGGSGEGVLFSTKIDTHLSYYYDKAGSGGHYYLWGKKALKANVWMALNEGDAVNATDNYSYTINSANRDFSVLLISFHNTQETYRVTFNINGNIAASNGIPAIPASLTIFIERLE